MLRADRFFRYNVSLILELGSISKVQGRPSHFCQSFGNLIKNAVEAMYDREKRSLRVVSSEKDGWITILIVDTGCGISGADMARIFAPYFSTKPLVAKGDEPVGIGLGLTSAQKMIEAHGGAIEIESAPGPGTTVAVRLPVRRAVRNENST
ncbi:MAG: HAMP domain-containing histidine kinase [Calothrix sp. SM1_5_4]|nr:HAMP domain-containing histidine kinase [Calothrix sp. SM1_5_4]